MAKQENSHWTDRYAYGVIPFRMLFVLGVITPSIRRSVFKTLLLNIVIAMTALYLHTWFGYVLAMGVSYTAAQFPSKDWKEQYRYPHFTISLIASTVFATMASDLLIGFWWLPFAIVLLVDVALVTTAVVLIIPIGIVQMIHNIWVLKIRYPYRWWSNAPYDKRKPHLIWPLVAKLYPKEPSPHWTPPPEQQS